MCMYALHEVPTSHHQLCMHHRSTPKNRHSLTIAATSAPVALLEMVGLTCLFRSKSAIFPKELMRHDAGALIGQVGVLLTPFLAVNLAMASKRPDWGAFRACLATLCHEMGSRWGLFWGL
ncbi:hypothetical protein DE146DRAFT_253901 [Phaeosphaeria sp. MPI-PUGE-AT-0046c]|nr:hypothetical protein DE146DRAFT_253901 [Phaeosphaeria sp. MPI-PUGE-AT-0046c]